MTEIDKAIEKIRELIQLLGSSKPPTGIYIERSKHVILTNNILIGCSMDIRNSEDIIAYANKIEDPVRRELIELLYELLTELKHEPPNVDRIRTLMNKLRELAEPIYHILASIKVLKNLLGL